MGRDRWRAARRPHISQRRPPSRSFKHRMSGRLLRHAGAWRERSGRTLTPSHVGQRTDRHGMAETAKRALGTPSGESGAGSSPEP